MLLSLDCFLWTVTLSWLFPMNCYCLLTVSSELLLSLDCFLWTVTVSWLFPLNCYCLLTVTHHWSNWETVLSTRSVSQLSDATIEVLLGEMLPVRSVQTCCKLNKSRIILVLIRTMTLKVHLKKEPLFRALRVLAPRRTLWLWSRKVTLILTLALSLVSCETVVGQLWAWLRKLRRWKPLPGDDLWIYSRQKT
jgi:hypothetical protein